MLDAWNPNSQSQDYKASIPLVLFALGTRQEFPSFLPFSPLNPNCTSSRSFQLRLQQHQLIARNTPSPSNHSLYTETTLHLLTQTTIMPLLGKKFPAPIGTSQWHPVPSLPGPHEKLAIPEGTHTDFLQ